MLLLDVGNSRCKWAHVVAGHWAQRGVIENAAVESLLPVFAGLPPPSRVLVSNVAGASMTARLRTLLSLWSCEPAFITAAAEQCGVRNGYRSPQQLGSDRWAALVGAWQQERGACLVVNCGTATTLDSLSGEGEFMGGVIVPGMALMCESLSNRAAQLQAGDGAVRDFPLNTADAIASGALRATQGAIMQQFGLLQQRCGLARCIVSGGAAEPAVAQLTVPYLWVDELVLRGLQVMGENEA
ncbi:type III pantothenate kinase [Ferrigenium sp. UT5]|uniref:type III pantothenate kinase n=1 Tax=Ferrigenium sp. UT5 TaxID=3242105 RepID=UPI00354C00C2